jgi:hypothetical protein
MIMRVDKQRTANIAAELLPGYAQGPVTAAAMKAIAEIELPEGYELRQAGLSEAMEENTSGMIIVFLTAILLVYMLLAAILENPLQPLFILSTIPLSLIGVVAGCLLFGTVLNNIAMIGIVMLVGIVVNNAILLLDYYNQLKREGLPATEALLKACPAKLKAILMSNIAIILGLIPMAMGIGASLAEMRQPMGIIVIGGILSSTVLTLWFIPTIERLVTSRVKHHAKKGIQIKGGSLPLRAQHGCALPPLRGRPPQRPPHSLRGLYAVHPYFVYFICSTTPFIFNLIISIVFQDFEVVAEDEFIHGHGSSSIDIKLLQVDFISFARPFINIRITYNL